MDFAIRLFFGSELCTCPSGWDRNKRMKGIMDRLLRFKFGTRLAESRLWFGFKFIAIFKDLVRIFASLEILPHHKSFSKRVFICLIFRDGIFGGGSNELRRNLFFWCGWRWWVLMILSGTMGIFIGRLLLGSWEHYDSYSIYNRHSRLSSKWQTDWTCNFFLFI